MGADLKKFDVLVLKKYATGQREFHPAGKAYANRDGTVTVYLELLQQQITLMLKPSTPPEVAAPQPRAEEAD